ncbi:MAG TPA: type IX secretion system sortase PorU, partial [Bacteroidales bacterium]|nr:type IX secretion system sortase PorU [Bacteroidales bacterium]
FNYTGHGGEIGLADEQILMREDLSGLTNFDHLPLFITATCEFSRFDDLMRSEDGNLTESTSAGEFSILNPNGGTIALVSTTRIVTSSDNYQLNTRFLQIALDRQDDGSYRTLGEIIRMTKNVLGDERNKLNFILLGDPALKLAIPTYSIITDSVNNVPVTQAVDTMKAFSRIIVSGHIEDNSQNLLTSYNGTIYPSVFDKNKTITTLANDIGTFPMQFTVREDLLYKGKASVKDGRFRFEFIVPKDITYNYGNGKITYFSSNVSDDANGSFSSFIIGGTDRSAQPDNSGPAISLYLNDEYFNNKGITNQNPVIFAEITDESGINTIGNGIGHDITGIIDDDTKNPVVMNDYFETVLDDFTSGILKYPMFGLSEGTHSLKVKVWDIYNNSSEAIIEFRVISGNSIIITKAGNFPNPATDHTSFIFEHNHADEELIATITVFDLGGRLIYTYKENISATGFNSITPVWDLKDMNGNILRPGIYPYRIRITDSRGAYADSYQKLVVVR